MKKIFTFFTLVFAFALQANAQVDCEVTVSNLSSGDTLFFTDLSTTPLVDFDTITSNGQSTVTVPSGAVATGNTQVVLSNGTNTNTTSVNVNFACNGWVESDLVYGQSYTNNNPLPVELSFFRAEVVNLNVFLKWQTSSEENNSGFEVQRSTDGVSWDVLTFVNGNGTTLEVQNYSFIDNLPVKGSNYYRLKQVDYDGQFEYSDVVSVAINDKVTFSVINTLVTNELLLTNDCDVFVYNSIGREIMNETNTNRVDMSRLHRGTYFVRLIKESNTKIIKVLKVK